MKDKTTVDLTLPAKAYVIKSAESTARGLLGAVPFVGTALNEAIFDFRARLKQERLEKFIEELTEVLHSVESEKIDRAYLQTEEFVDFLEDVLIRATKVKADDKRKQLAGVLAGRVQHAEGTSFDDRFLDLLISLSDVQVKILGEHFRAYEVRQKLKKDSADASKDHRNAKFYGVSDSNYRFLVQDLISKVLVYDDSAGRWDTRALQFLEVTELGQAFLHFLDCAA